MDKNLKQEGLYGCLRYFAKSGDLKLIAGNRLEKRLINKKEIIGNTSEKKAKNIFLIEGEEMLHGLAWQSENLIHYQRKIK